AAAKGDGGTIKLQAPNGQISFGSGSLTALPGTDGKVGGTIDIESQSISVPGTPVVITSESIDISTTGASSDLGVGGAPGQMVLSGSKVSISAGRTLTVNMVALTLQFSLANNDAPSVSLAAGAAGTGNLLITGSIDAGGPDGSGTGNGGSITLSSASTQAFVVGGATVNGLTGTVTAQGGTAAGERGTM